MAPTSPAYYSRHYPSGPLVAAQRQQRRQQQQHQQQQQQQYSTPQHWERQPWEEELEAIPKPVAIGGEHGTPEMPSPAAPKKGAGSAQKQHGPGYTKMAKAEPDAHEPPNQPEKVKPEPELCAQRKDGDEPEGALRRILRCDAIKDGDEWLEWVVKLKARYLNSLIVNYNLTKVDADDLKKASRRYKQRATEKSRLRAMQEAGK